MHISLKLARLATSMVFGDMGLPPAAFAAPLAAHFPSAAEVNDALARSDDYRGTSVRPCTA